MSHAWDTLEQSPFSIALLSGSKYYENNMKKKNCKENTKDYSNPPKEIVWWRDDT